ncbi:MAG: alpha-amylase family glycosyl hydrolase [Acidobacteriaceae bacterium]
MTFYNLNQEAAVIDLSQVGAFPSFAADGDAQIRFGLYLPGIQKAGGFRVVVRIIHAADRFNPSVKTQDADLAWTTDAGLDLWSATVTLATGGTGHAGDEGDYLYRYQLWWTNAAGQDVLITNWFPDPFARYTDIGLMSSTVLAKTPTAFAWTDAAYRTPELEDLIVYELQAEEFNDSFDGVAERLDFLASLGVNCLELMPVTSNKLDFDWGYGPVYHFSPSAHFGGANGLKRLVNAAHARGIAIILDVVYEHVDPAFAYYGVYNDLANTVGAPHPASPLTKGMNVWGFGPACDFTQPFCRDFFVSANEMWMDEYHVDGFRYDEVTDLYVGARAAGYQDLAQRVYVYSLGIARFQQAADSYSRIIQCAETLGISRQVMNETYTNAAWTDDLLNKVENMIVWNYVDDNFAHILDPTFSGYPSFQTVVDASGNAVQRPVAPFQYLESHDHSQLIVFAGTNSDGGPLPEGNRDLFYRLQPYAIALYTCQGIPMLWQGQEWADNYNLPGTGAARVHLRRDTHWEYFYDLDGQPLIRVYRRLGQLRRSSRALRGTQSFYYYQQSHQQTQIIAYHRYASATSTGPEEWAMVLLNFAGSAGQISVPFPKAGTWQEMLDADQRTYNVTVLADGAIQTIVVPSNYGMVFIRQGS